MYTCPYCLYEQNLAPAQRFCWKCRRALDPAAVAAVVPSPPETGNRAVNGLRLDLVAVPPPYPQGGVPEDDTRQRGGCLTTYLVVFTTLSVLDGILFILFGSALQATLAIPAWALATNTVGALLMIGCYIALWNWKSWGAYGLIGLNVLDLPLSVLSGRPWTDLVLTVVSLIILIFALSKAWVQMD